MSANIFVKLHLSAFQSGMFADMGAETWAALCAIASYMDGDGCAWPTQDQLAETMGVSRVSATRRISKLLAYRWRGDPIVTVSRRKGRMGYRNEYRILGASGLTIF